MEELLSKLYGLNVRDSALHAWLCCRWPSVADPEPITAESPSPPSLISPTRTPRPSFGSFKRWRKEITEGGGGAVVLNVRPCRRWLVARKIDRVKIRKSGK